MNIVAMAQGYVLKIKLSSKRGEEFNDLCDMVITLFFTYNI